MTQRTVASPAYAGLDGLRRFRADLRAWVDDHEDELVAEDVPPGLAGDVARMRHVLSQLYAADWNRWGWPEHVGGLGGGALLRVAVADEAMRRGFFPPSPYTLFEILGPVVSALAPELARSYVPQLLSGKEGWCQGFSEPDAGSDLASLRCRAIDDGDTWRVTGQKIWTSYAQFASRIVLLTRTGTTESRHRGITALFVDMDSPGITIRPLQAINGSEEFSEVFFDDVVVPKDRVIGEVDGGWQVAMTILRAERGGIFWMESGWMTSRLADLVSASALGDDADEALGNAYASVAALRSRSWTTQHRITADTIETPETSIDKILHAAAEQEVFDLVLGRARGIIELGDDADAAHWRAEYLFSRAATIYGGTAEIQRNIVADRVLCMGRAS